MAESPLARMAGVLRGVRTSLSLGGLTVIVLCVIYNQILGLGIFSTITDTQTTSLLLDIVGYVFWLAIVAVVLGIAGYLVGPAAGREGWRGVRRRR